MMSMFQWWIIVVSVMSSVSFGWVLMNIIYDIKNKLGVK